MKLWLVVAKEYSWDEYIGFVVRAGSSKTARKLCSEAEPDFKDRWLDPKQSTCSWIQDTGKAEIILESYQAG